MLRLARIRSCPLPRLPARVLQGIRTLGARTVATESGGPEAEEEDQEITNFDALEMVSEEFQDDDSPSVGHVLLQQRRDTLHYLRLIEHDMRNLVAYRQPFVAPTAAEPLIVRSLDYAGEEHPATAKRVIVAPVAQLPLRDQTAIHKFKLLAGVRWTPQPPANAGVSSLQRWDEGFIKIACERFPEPAMNFKWASDVLDRLVQEANNPLDKFQNVPLDIRHVYAKMRKDKKGEHRRNHWRPSIRDFPQEWLPVMGK